MGARGDQCVHHERDGPLLCPAAHRTMLITYARNCVYLIVGPLHGSVRSHRVQVGGRERCHPLQRSTARECAEGNGSPAPDLQGTEATAGTGFGGGASKAPPPYSSCAVAQPANDDTFPNATSVGAAVVTNPGVRPGDEVVLLLDGSRVPIPTGRRLHHDQCDRPRPHSLQAIIRDGAGQVVCQSTNVTFTVLQPSVLNPANPNFHR